MNDLDFTDLWDDGEKIEEPGDGRSLTERDERTGSDADLKAGADKVSTAGTAGKATSRSERKADGKTQEEPEEGASLSIEEIFEQLDAIIGKLEDGSISLEDSFEYYETGMRLVRACGKKIDRVEKQILVVNQDGLA